MDNAMISCSLLSFLWSRARDEQEKSEIEKILDEITGDYVHVV